jgi:hypothetical protein
LAAGQIFFNDLLSLCQSMIENTIEIWKVGFPFLRNIWVKIASKSDMQFLIKLVKVSAVLHNLLVDHHTISWLSLEDLKDPKLSDDLDDFFIYLKYSVVGAVMNKCITV